MAFIYRYNRADLSDIKILSEANKLRNDIRSIRFSLNYDSRNNLFNASRGRFLEWSVELAGSFLQGSEDFWKIRWKVKNFWEISSSTVIATSAEVGWTDFFGRSKAIPLNERFYLGGSDVLRAFEYRMAGALDPGGEPIGGNLKIAANLIELRRAIYRMVGGVVFFDVGGVWQNPADLRLNDLRYCVGTGLRVNMPIGIIRADYGINLDRWEGEPPGQFYFSIGQAF
jgi:outer membrane protein insertion porin family